MSVRLYIGNLSEDVDKQALEERLCEISKPVSLKIVTDRKTGQCRGFGFATVESDEVAQKYIAELNAQPFGDATLKVEVAQSRDKETAPAAAKSGGGGGKSGKSGGKRGNRGGSNFVDKTVAAQPDPRWADQLQRIKEQLQSAKV
ncbi:RNA-binding protein [Synechococcus sp. PCC 7336]|uniref:RNA recognition motif domain-containing protein n=1 Tax=Synechococcus sp. PCC 7336 TaxID=195250 RepID=UPI00034B556D|nr:RNA-binding protein [Synechococcus sp. PCC 7336]